MDPTLNSSFGSFGTGGVSSGGFSSLVGSGNGDVVISSGTEQKRGKKKWMIVGIGAAVLLVVIGVVVLIATRGPRLEVSGTAYDAFNRYANYFLYGEDSDAEIEGEYDEDGSYQVDEMYVADNEERNAFWNKATSLLDDFEMELDNEEGDNDGELMAAAGDYREEFELMKLTFMSEIVDEAEFYNKTIALGSAEAKAWVEPRFALFTNSEYELVNNYGQAAIEHYQVLADYYEKAKELGCLVENGVNEECLNGDNEELVNLDTEVMLAYDEMDYILGEVDSNVVEGCWELPKLMRGEDEENEEGDESDEENEEETEEDVVDEEEDV